MTDSEHNTFDPGDVSPGGVSSPRAELQGDLQTVTSQPIEISPPQEPVFPPWSGWDVAAVLAFTLATVMVCSLAALGVARLLTSGRHIELGDLATSALVVIGAQIVAYPAVIMFMATLVRNKAREAFWRAIHWNWPGTRAVIFLLAGAALAFVVEFASQYLPIPKSLPMDKFFNEMTGAYLMAVFGVTLAPLLEELFFRGMLYPLARRATGVTPAVLVTATAFASIHGAQLGYAWAPLLSIFVVGVVFTIVRERTGSVAASFLMHCGYNLALFGTLWVASDGFRHLEKVAD
jgi:membrane protease YdiL (CAAX protease family)